MERRYVKCVVHVDMPGGEAPGIDVGDSSTAKVQKALDIIFTAGVAANDFTLEEMDVAEDAAVGFVLIHDNA